jgi:hypothetical protein
MNDPIAASPQFRTTASPDGRDEMNLAEFPMALLSHRAPPGQRTLQHSKTIRGPDGKPLEQRWTITASDAYGLPVAGDEELFLALLDVSHRQGFPEVVTFSRYELIQRMNRKPTGENYRRILDGLRRLSSVSFFAQNAFFDNARKTYLKEVKFNVIAEYAIADGERTQPSFPLSWIRWGQPVLDSIRAGNIKSINLNRYFRLEGSITKRLYRFLDKKFGRKDHFMIDLFLLAHEHLGMTRSWRYASDVRRRLEPCLEELKKDGYLAGWHYRKNANNDGVVIEFRRARQPEEPSASPFPQSPASEQDTDPAKWFIERLTGEGATTTADQRAARKFIDEHGIDVFRQFADFAVTWREENWPEMRTLCGAVKACSTAFFADQRERTELTQRRLEQDHHLAWLHAIDRAAEEYRRTHGDAVMRFEEGLQLDADYKSALAQIESFRGNESLKAYATAKARQIRLEAFRSQFDCGIPEFSHWKP